MAAVRILLAIQKTNHMKYTNCVLCVRECVFVCVCVIDNKNCGTAAKHCALSLYTLCVCALAVVSGERGTVIALRACVCMCVLYV